MQIRVFTVPAADPAPALAEINSFLATSRVLEVEKKFFQNDAGGYWTFCVSYVAGTAPGGSGASVKVDYKATLPPETFAVFSRLRVIRKALAEAEGVPIYAVFTNEELASVAALPEITENALKTVPGIGDKKLEKYGAKMLEEFKKN
jgi:superfamily II DNA helicase RecQ